MNPCYPASAIGRCLILAIATSGFAVASAQGQWLEFGGPNRDFTVKNADLADHWPEKGPEVLWSRPLGDGYSTILADEDRLYTMYESGGKQAVICMASSSGETIWEFKYKPRFPKKMDRSFGTGPRATPLIVGDRLFVAGIDAHLHCLDTKDGHKLWSHELAKEYGATELFWGYSSSAVAYGKTVILPVGGKGAGVMAFDQESGSVVWSRHDFGNAYSTGVLINLDGQDQLVMFVEDLVVGLDPKTGDSLWQYDHKTDWNVNASMPLFGEDNILFVSSAYKTGSRALKLSRKGDKTQVEELWHKRKMKVHHGNAIRIDDFVYASSGDNGPSFFGAINVKTGKLAWRERGLAKATALLADGKLILVDQDGHLALASATPEAFTIDSKHAMLGSKAWAAPTLVGQTLLVRDRKIIMALNLGVD